MVQTLQPHKEERFMFVVYSMIAFCGGLSLAMIEHLFSEIVSKLFPRRVKVVHPFLILSIYLSFLLSIYPSIHLLYLYRYFAVVSFISIYPNTLHQVVTLNGIMEAAIWIVMLGVLFLSTARIASIGGMYNMVGWLVLHCILLSYSISSSVYIGYPYINSQL